MELYGQCKTRPHTRAKQRPAWPQVQVRAASGLLYFTHFKTEDSLLILGSTELFQCIHTGHTSSSPHVECWEPRYCTAITPAIHPSPGEPLHRVFWGGHFYPLQGINHCTCLWGGYTRWYPNKASYVLRFLGQLCMTWSVAINLPHRATIIGYQLLWPISLVSCNICASM